MRRFLFLIITASLLQFSCTVVQERDTSNLQEVWEGGIMTAQGNVMEVSGNGDNQVLLLKNQAGKEYTIILSKENLGEKAFQYRNFKIGEEIGFRGPLDNKNIMIAIEILENM